MTRPSSLSPARLLASVVLALLAASFSSAQPSDEEIRQTVARISYLNGSVSYARGDDPDDWQAADLNVPMTAGDRLYTGDDGRAELQIHGGFSIRIGARADLAALNLTDDTKQWSLRAGSAAFRLRRLGENDLFEVDTPNAAITFERTGDYRVDVDADGNTRVTVRRGRAIVASGGGQVPLNAGDEMDIDGIDSPQYDVVAMAEPDRFDRWVGDRERRFERASSTRYVHEDLVGVEDLDENGRWQSIPSYGIAWSPSSVEADWQPYRAGHWMWQDPWGWTWVGAERWGWAPYHYGRWVNWSSRWWWVPVARSVRVVAYAPALVAFSGGGTGWSSRGGGGFVGWFPLAPRDPFIHWWGARREANVVNVTYVNRTYITVVNHNTFVSGGLVTRDWVRDRSVVATVMQAPVLRGPLPIVPTQASLRVAVQPGLAPVIRPPQVFATRPVVVRTEPPPPPPSFRAKVTVIERNNGAPITAVDSNRLAVSDRGSARPVVVTRSVAGDQGRVTFAPKSENSKQPRPEPVTAGRGRVPSGETAPPSGAPTSQSDRGRRPDVVRPDRPTPVPQPTAGPSSVPQDRGRRPDVVRPTPVPQAPTDSSGTPQERGRRPDVVRPTPVPQPTAGPASVPQDRGRRPDVVQPTPVPQPPSDSSGTQQDRGRRPDVVRPTPVPQPPSDSSGTQQDRGRRPDVVRPTPVPPPPQGSSGAPPDRGRRPDTPQGEVRPTPVPERGRQVEPARQPAPEREKPKEKPKEKEKDKTPTPRPS